MGEIDKRYVGLDLLRAIAAFGIVGRHLNLAPMSRAGEILLNYTDLNVGVFGAISGFFIGKALFEGNNFVLADFLKRRYIRIIPMYLIWTLVYIVFGFVFSLAFKGGVNPKFFRPDFWINSLFFGSASCHLWYLASLFYVTILIAVAFRLMPRLVQNGVCLLTLVLGMLYLSCSAEYDWWHTYFCRLLSYVALGMLIYRVKDRLAGVPIIFGVCCLVLTLMGRTMMTRYFNWFTLDFAVVVPLIVLCCRWRGAEPKVVRFLAVTSFGVYLVHPIISAGCNVLITRLFGGNYDVRSLILAWVMVWITAFGVSSFLMHFTLTRKFIGN